MNYGLPYMGSKSKIAQKIINTMPSAETFVDLFAGGCSVTHVAMLSGKYKRFIANDINGQIPQLFLDAVNGKFRNETRWISRDDFYRLKDIEPYVRVCWSFGNNARDYIYSRTIEPYKRALHYVVFYDDWTEFSELCPEVADVCRQHLQAFASYKDRRIEIGRAVVRRLKEIGDYAVVENNPLYNSCHRKPRGDKHGKLDSLEPLHSANNIERLKSLEDLKRLESTERLERLQDLEDLKRLQSLESLERLERLQSMEQPNLSRLSVSGLSYEQVEIPDNSVVYVDKPYDNTTSDKKGKYGDGFDHAKFYDWVRTKNYPIFISEYTAPDDFECILEMRHQSTYCATKSFMVAERLFVHNSQLNNIPKTTLF